MQELIETLNKVFKGNHTGAYLDIGAYDGVTDNVTNFFYQHGWRGVCIEPQTKYHKLGIANRPEDQWIKGVVVAVYHEGKRVTFYEDDTGKHSSTAPFEGTKKKQLKVIKVNDDLPRDTFPNGLDLLVINTGDDYEVLQSIDLGIFKPHIIATPGFTAVDRSLIEHMQLMGYYHLAANNTGEWLVFSNDYEDTNAL
jgi:FkbM family methyltransferase